MFESLRDLGFACSASVWICKTRGFAALPLTRPRPLVATSRKPQDRPRACLADRGWCNVCVTREDD